MALYSLIPIRLPPATGLRFVIPALAGKINDSRWHLPWSISRSTQAIGAKPLKVRPQEETARFDELAGRCGTQNHSYVVDAESVSQRGKRMAVALQ